MIFQILSFEGWLNGFTAIAIVILGCAFGLFFYYKSKKLNIKLLSYIGLAIFFAGLIYSGLIYDFLTVLLTGKNMDNTLFSIIIWMWAPPTVLLVMYIGAELMIPEKKWYVVLIFSVLGIAFELFLFLDTTGSMTYYIPETQGEDLIDIILTFGSPAFISMSISILSALIFCGLGFLLKSIKSKGVIRKKFLFCSIAVILYSGCGMIDGLIFPGIAFFLIRVGLIISFCFWYLALKEEPAEPKKIHTKKEIKIEESIFRLYERPAQITEEEVIFHIEKKICLVCKGKVGGFMYMCSNCSALYCGNCAQSLIQLENACWACNEAIDKFKPVKLEKEEEFNVKISENGKK